MANYGASPRTTRFSTRRKAALLAAGVVASLAAAGTVQAAGNIVVNGSFESPTVPANGFTTFTVGQTIGGGFTVTKGDVDVVGRNFNGSFPVSDGIQSLDLNGCSAGTVSQTLPTVVGTNYTLTFDYATNPNGGTVDRTFDVMVDVGTTNYTVPARTTSFTTATINFTATSTATKLSFTSTTTADSICNGPVLDNIVVVANSSNPTSTPEPGGSELFAAGILPILGVYLLRRRRQNRTA